MSVRDMNRRQHLDAAIGYADRAREGELFADRTSATAATLALVHLQLAELTHDIPTTADLTGNPEVAVALGRLNISC